MCKAQLEMLKQELPIVISLIVISLTLENEKCHNLHLLSVSYTGDITKVSATLSSRRNFLLNFLKVSQPLTPVTYDITHWHFPQYVSFSEMMSVCLLSTSLIQCKHSKCKLLICPVHLCPLFLG